MNKSHIPLRLNVGYMYNKPIGTSREIPIEFDSLEIDELVINHLSSLVRLSRTREGLLLQVKADAEVETDCVRCLCDFFLPVSTEFEELYQFPSRHREETDLMLPDDGYLDLASLFREYLILAIPINGICKPDCKGLCVICGANLNDETCEHQLSSEASSEMLVGEETD